MTLKTIFRVVTDEPVEFGKRPVEVRDFRKFPHHSREISRTRPQFHSEELEDVNTSPVGLEIAKIWTAYAQKTLCHTFLQLSQTSWVEGCQIRYQILF